MKTVNVYLDFVSPFAWLAFDALPSALADRPCRLSYRPVLFGGLVRHHGNRGPAEIPAKRDWTYRHVLWLAHRQGTQLKMPATHPFNPVPLLCAALACDGSGRPDRSVCEDVFRHVWVDGAEPLDPVRLERLHERLPLQRDPAWTEVRALLRANTAEAIERGVFGVPSFEVDGRVFWGFDAIPMLCAWLYGDPWFAGPDWDEGPRVRYGLPRD